VGHLEDAGLVGLGAGEGAAGVAEHEGVGEVRRDGRAVEDDEGAAGAGRAVVQAAGDQLLAGAGVAGDEHGEGAGRQGRDALELGEQLAHDGAPAEQVAEVIAGREQDLDLVGADELQGGLADLERGVEVDEGLAHADAADEHAVGAAEVAEDDRGGLELEREVQAADEVVLQDDVGGGTAAAAEQALAGQEDLEGAARLGAAQDHEVDATEALIAGRRGAGVDRAGRRVGIRIHRGAAPNSGF
jgi:hypothetical protein